MGSSAICKNNKQVDFKGGPVEFTLRVSHQTTLCVSFSTFPFSLNICQAVFSFFNVLISATHVHER